MISKVRDYINQSIKSVDSDLKEIEQAFELDVPENLTNNSYYTKYDITSVENYQQHISNTVSLTTAFYFDALRDSVGAYDNAMNLVNQITLKAIGILNIEAFSNTDENKIISVNSISQIGESLEGNSRQIVITAEFEMIINQAICN